MGFFFVMGDKRIYLSPHHPHSPFLHQGTHQHWSVPRVCLFPELSHKHVLDRCTLECVTDEKKIKKLKNITKRKISSLGSVWKVMMDDFIRSRRKSECGQFFSST